MHQGEQVPGKKVNEAEDVDASPLEERAPVRGLHEHARPEDRREDKHVGPVVVAVDPCVEVVRPAQHEPAHDPQQREEHGALHAQPLGPEEEGCDQGPPAQEAAYEPRVRGLIDPLSLSSGGRAEEGGVEGLSLDDEAFHDPNDQQQHDGAEGVAPHVGHGLPLHALAEDAGDEDEAGHAVGGRPVGGLGEEAEEDPVLVDHHGLQDVARHVELGHPRPGGRRLVLEGEPDVVRRQRQKERKDDARHVAYGERLPHGVPLLLSSLGQVCEVGLLRAKLVGDIAEHFCTRHVADHLAQDGLQNQGVPRNRNEGDLRSIVRQIGLHQLHGVGAVVGHADARLGGALDLFRRGGIAPARDPAGRGRFVRVRVVQELEPEAARRRNGILPPLRPGGQLGHPGGQAVGLQHPAKLLARAVARDLAVLLQVQQPAVEGPEHNGPLPQVEGLHIQVRRHIFGVLAAPSHLPRPVPVGWHVLRHAFRQARVRALLHGGHPHRLLVRGVRDRGLEAPSGPGALRLIDGAAEEPGVLPGRGAFVIQH
mmetsp:Transcript_56335/g.164659  ORF Transcript_56335/g.164659 Transcript_56335/m.164659 type:complete len:537 (+) Transcript_56335:625-2235(+)